MQEIDARLARFPVRVRLMLIAIGAHYGSDRTLAQANRTLNAHEKYGDKVGPLGFKAAKVAELTWARDGLVTAGAGRDTARTGSKATNQALIHTMKAGKGQRLAMRARLMEAGEDLEISDADGAASVATALRTTLDHTSSAGADPGKLAAQLDELANFFDAPAVRAEVEGDPAAVQAAARATATRLRALEKSLERPLGTPEETQRLDLLDGLILRLVRQARRAARAAARQYGDPAIEKAYGLDALYESTSPGPDAPPVS